MMDFKPDTPSERQRKRRSSRTGGLSSKDPWASTLLFRTVPEERYSIWDWQAAVDPRISQRNSEPNESFESRFQFFYKPICFPRYENTDECVTSGIPTEDLKSDHKFISSCSEGQTVCNDLSISQSSVQTLGSFFPGKLSPPSHGIQLKSS
jgi:hypothetical protein